MLAKAVRSLRQIASLSCLLSTFAIAATLSAQSAELSGPARSIPNRIVGSVDESARVKLGGTVHPLATKANDRGPVSDGLKLDRLQVVLKRSSAQESELKQLIGDMHTPGSANYHKWLTPDDFGKRFGPSDADVAKVQGWLSSHGFSITKLNAGRQTLEIAGSAGQFRDTFHSAMHSYQVKGQTRYANSSDPEIPAALAPVFGGFASLNNFPLKSYSHVLGKASYNPVTHESKPEWTIGDSSGVSLLLSPADYAVQYDLPAHSPGVSDGTGTSIAIINESNINISLVDRFRTLFGLPANSPQVVIDGNDPGIDGINNTDGLNYASGEAYLDVEWAGALAPGATVNLVIGSDSAVGSGLLYAASRAVYSNISPVVSLSFGGCELEQGSTNAFFSNLWQQAAAQGITVVVSSGDSGSAQCDNDNTQAYAVNGQAVNGAGSTPYNIAVGGTDFYYTNYATGGTALTNELETYWNLTPSNASPVVSLLQRVPEQPWNNSQYGFDINDYNSFYGTTTIAGAGGGASNCAFGIEDSNGNYTACSGGYAKPSWQTGAGVPSDGKRDMPDVSLFASSGANASYYPFCASDGDCQPNSTEVQIGGVGGTSASAPSFAGIMALVNQKFGRQGQANYVLYPLATQFPATFHDVTVGSNAVPCNISTVTDGNSNFPPTDCIAVSFPITATDSTYGTSVEGELGVSAGTPSYNATVGYDLASGLGTVDVSVLLANWNKIAFGASSVTLTPSSTTFAHGTSVTISGGVTATPTPTGDVTLMTDSTTVGNQGETIFTLVNGAFSGSVSYLPGGTYNIWGNYGGDGFNAASSSIANKTQITVTPENSTTALTIYTPSSTLYYGETLTNGTSVPYGTPLYTSAQPTGSNGTTTVATGSMVFSDGSSTLNTAVLNSGGEGEYFGFYPVGSHSVKAAYSGDASYNASTSPAFSFTVAKATPSYDASSSNSTSAGLTGGQQTAVVFTLENTNSFVGNPAPPTGTVTLSGAPTGSTTSATLAPAIDPFTGGTEGVATFLVPAVAANTYTFTFNYAGDANYNAVSNVQYTLPFLAAGSGVASTTTATASGTGTASPASVVTLTATVTGRSGGPVPTGTISVDSPNEGTYGTFTLPTGSGNSTTITLSFNSSGLAQGTNELTVQYSGDSTYQPSIATAKLYNPLSDFQMVPLKTIVSAPSSTAATDTINLSSTNNFAGTVSLTCSGAGGITCSLSPAAAVLSAGGSASTVVTINTSAVTATGTYNVVVRGSDSTGNFVHTIGLQVVVPTAAAPIPGFTLTNTAPIAITAPGNAGSSIVSATPTNGFTGDVALSCAITSSPSSAVGTPTCSLAPATASITGTAAAMSTLTVNTGITTTAGSYTVTVTGVSGSITQTASVAVNVPTGPGFTVTGPSSASTVAGGPTVTAALSVTPTGGFTGDVALTCAITVNPSQATSLPTCSLSPTTASLTGTAAVASTLSMDTTASTTPGLYSIIVTAVSGSITQSLNFSLTVTAIPVPGFALSAPAISIATQGGTGTSTVTATPSGGFTGSVALACALTTSPSGASDLPTCSLSPTSVTIASGSSAPTSTLTINTTAQTSAGFILPMKSIFATGGGAVLAALLFFGVPFGRRGKRELKTLRALRILSLAAVFALLAGAGMGCGGGSTPAPPPLTGGTTTGAYVFTVTATSGAITQTATVAVTVN